MSALAILAGQIEQQPHALRSDLDGVVHYVDALAQVFETVQNEVFIDHAVVQLANSAGYPVGYITFDSEAEAYRFIPHQDKQED